MTDLVEQFGNIIRTVDGNHDLGAGALAEKLVPFIEAAAKEARAKALREAAEVIRSNRWAASAGLHNDVLALLDKKDVK